jgi:predicted DsbA family dithiol-disulfide isomerase
VLTLDLYSDLVCPWCYIGSRRLARALAREPAGSVRVRLRAFELQPELPSEGVPAIPFYTTKFGSEARMRQAFARVTDIGRGEGIRFDFDRLQRAPNTRLAHRVLALVEREGLATRAAQAFFAGHFEEGADLAQEGELLELLRRHDVPLDAADLRRRLAAGEGDAEVDLDLEHGRQLGIQGVPAFIVNDTWGLSGAQPPETLSRFLVAARQQLAARQANAPN